MKRNILTPLAFLLLLLLATPCCMAQSSHYTSNRAPLMSKPYLQLPLGDIEAQGWIKLQLEAQATGLTGHLGEIYEAVCGPRNCWLGGDGDAWERGPYWIDGLLPLAYILHDEKLIAKTKPWIEWTLASQTADGQFGPTIDRTPEPGLQRNNALDWWPRMVVLKIMQQYYEATQDQRVISFLTRYFRYQLATLPSTPLDNWTFWGKQRGGDNLMVALWLYNITGDAFLLDLADLLHEQTLDWTHIFHQGDELHRANSLHCVNLGQGFKEPVVYYQRSLDNKHRSAPHQAMKRMRHTIGLPTGLWGGDELLRMGQPTAGSELCTAVEMMFSLETMLQITGDDEWAEQLELIAYNPLPAQTDDEFTSRQYFQQNNQVMIDRTFRNFSTPHSDTDNVFGVLTGYPCCTCNMHQGWPKFVQNLWYATTDGGAAAMVYGPSKATIKVGSKAESVTISETTDYPFDETIVFTISQAPKKGVTFPLTLRIPSWANNAKITINGNVFESVAIQAGKTITINRLWNVNDRIELTLPMKLKSSRWYDNSGVIERGPLLYALKMDEKWEKQQIPATDSRYGEWYWQVTSSSPWNYALPEKAVLNPNQHFSVEKHPINGAYPWNTQHAPVVLKTKAARLNGWTVSRGSTNDVSFFTQQGIDYGQPEEITLIPYGCTALRITQFPIRDY